MTIAGAIYTLPATVCLTGNGNYAYSISAPRFNTNSGTVSLNSDCASCGSPNPTLGVASGYMCICYGNCGISSSPLTLTDSAYGTFTLTYQGSSPNYNWLSNTKTVSYPGDNNCFANNTDMWFTLACVTSGQVMLLTVYWLSTYPFPEHPCPTPTGSTQQFIVGAGGGGGMTLNSCPFSGSASVGGSSPPELYPSGATFTWTE